MASITKEARRVTLAWRNAVVDHTPPWAKRAFGPAAHYLDMLFIDHGIFRVIYLNRHRLGEGAWRAAQPTPGQLKRIARDGVRTIVNLRGERMCGSYWLEKQTCERVGLQLVNYQMRSRAAPSRAEILGARDVLQRIAYPALIHCKSGADRAGLMSVIYRHVRDGWPIERARSELALRFGHIRQANTGILDRFFDSYVDYNRHTPIEFFDWVETVYDAEALKNAYQSQGWANRITDSVLRRE
jgi:protein tyrosine/serine phosphatase